MFSQSKEVNNHYFDDKHTRLVNISNITEGLRWNEQSDPETSSKI